jgi:hypothetical protein
MAVRVNFTDRGRPRTLSARDSTSLWKRALAFCFGFCIQFNLLLGIGGQVASSTGLYGYRLIDMASFGAVGLLALYSLVPHRILPLAVYGSIIAALFSAPILSSDPQTTILAYRYMLYSLAALYVVVITSETSPLEWFCWGLIIGLVATIPIFVLQDSAYAGKLIEWGVTPRYAQTLFYGAEGGFLRYSGLSGHPNEAGHVAALSAAAGAYFALARKKNLPLIITAIGVVAVFYYTRNRGGLFVGGAILALSLILAQGRATFVRFAVTAAVIAMLGIVALQVDFIASRFGDDAVVANNLSERLMSTLAGFNILLSHPLGLPIDEFSSYVFSETSAVSTPHNGFIFFGGVFGLLALLVLVYVCGASLRVRIEGDIFYAFFALQVALSLLFEQLPATCSYEFAICLLFAHEYIRTPIGLAFTLRVARRHFQVRATSGSA